MIKALLKKELLQFLSMYTINKKNGKTRSVGVTVLILLALAMAFVSISMMFFGMYTMLGEAIAPTGSDWLLFSIAAAITLTMVGQITNSSISTPISPLARTMLHKAPSFFRSQEESTGPI